MSTVPKATPLRRPVRAAVIGCGGMGRNHIQALAALPAILLVGIADIFPANLERGGERGQPTRRATLSGLSPTPG